MNPLSVQNSLTIWQLGDGKPGHENQALGLTEAMGRMRSCEVHRIDISGAGNFWTRWRAALKQAKTLPVPDLIIGAGHATHFPLWCLRRASGAPTVVLMQPSLPMGFFDVCLVPRHDFQGAIREQAGLIVTEGALNRVKSGEAARRGKLVLLGGPSKTHGWDGDAMMESLRQLTDEAPDEEWQLTDSRRTPNGFTERIRKELPKVTIHLHTETGPDWLPKILQEVEEVWVTEDSVSMTYEALSSGAKVGLLPVPRLREDARVLRGLNHLLEQKRLTDLKAWLAAGRVLPEPQALREADRCAELVLDRL